MKKVSSRDAEGKHALVLVERKDDVPRVDSRALAERLGGEHQSTLVIIDRFLADFEEFGVCAPHVDKPQAGSEGGRPARYYLLNEDQATLLLTYSKNTPKARVLKKELIRLYKGYKNAYLRRASLDWQTARNEGKIVRRQETDSIKAFVAYAESQGSKSAFRYYCTLTKMEYKALGFLELGLGESLRDKLSIVLLGHLQTADSIVTWALQDGMDRKMPYKDIYQYAKNRVETYASALPPARFFHEAGPEQLRLQA